MTKGKFVGENCVAQFIFANRQAAAARICDPPNMSAVRAAKRM